ncbi:MAG TPA: hypothetical protein ENJ89_07915 [Caldithrix abyssi]|uniref:Uncharacterized protein n=1 Tax=Caldithrix abyssi TaxID=187145 RepID=A0A7V5PQ77_CALAY|nr:hypothetical protein [Caldithrix abyssi]
METLLNWQTALDTAIIVIPLLIVLYLIVRFIVPKKPALGIGLALGTGLIGALLVRSRLKKAFDVEKKIAEHNEMMARFKQKQKQRYEAVLANKRVIEVLEKQRKKLAKDAAKHETELRLIEAELKDRKELNEKILSESEEFLASVEGRSAERKRLLDRYAAETGDVPQESDSGGPIEIDGYRLIKE